jgi:hypothetical protein
MVFVIALQYHDITKLVFTDFFVIQGDMDMKNNVLPEFQDYLRSKSLVNQKYILFYAHCARRKSIKVQ